MTKPLSKKARDAKELMAKGAYWRKQLETQWRGGEKFETRLYMDGYPVKGYGFKTHLEMEDAGLLKYKPCARSTTWPSEWILREDPLDVAA
jgi:hypothetical protein